MEGLGAGLPAASFVAPGIDDKEREDKESEKEQEDRAGFCLPQSLATSGELSEIHADEDYTILELNPSTDGGGELLVIVMDHGSLQARTHRELPNWRSTVRGLSAVRQH